MQQIQGVIPKTSDKAASAGGAAVSITYAGVAGVSHYIYAIHASYSASPTGGGVTVYRKGETSNDIVFDADIPGTFIEVGYHMPLKFQPGEQVKITLKAGGGAVVGKLNVEHYLG